MQRRRMKVVQEGERCIGQPADRRDTPIEQSRNCSNRCAESTKGNSRNACPTSRCWTFATCPASLASTSMDWKTLVALQQYSLPGPARGCRPCAVHPNELRLLDSGCGLRQVRDSVTQGVNFNDDRTRSRYVLRRLLEEPWAVRASPEHGGRWVSALKKRVERARKFRSLTSALPVSVLFVVPHICVTRLDKIGLKQLALLPSAVVAHGDSLAALLALIARTDEAVLQGLVALSGKGGDEEERASSCMEE
ncbi:hypothetical protein SAICODRAFT_226840 [Saitoella complicata NRRL Y-17804]|uniref:uncharacterized protein n=1 Tax=Saitoella complicata (strain BCRC 22490 / CBS 7301 / JCM 7358 / NBRC 10748 / NRRL Y-17804) TaxID=698492 RepID=UPI000866A700|nr:uncharacterized protein SAICODRAFT_226840 [Saitoella complicata NRRL Y-17804]ODQ51296.1 hypothetical protein SAICODRAFT_226840 [Saitoella complicata NRRL Y-17804]